MFGAYMIIGCMERASSARPPGATLGFASLDSQGMSDKPRMPACPCSTSLPSSLEPGWVAEPKPNSTSMHTVLSINQLHSWKGKTDMFKISAVRLVLNLRQDKLLNCLASAARALSLKPRVLYWQLARCPAPNAEPLFSSWLDSVRLGTECAKSACAAAGGNTRIYYAAAFTADLVQVNQSLAVVLELAVTLYISGTNRQTRNHTLPSEAVNFMPQHSTFTRKRSSHSIVFPEVTLEHT